MNAIKFIQQHGVEKARKHYLDIREAANQVSFVHACEPFASQLNRLIESVDLVESLNGVETAKRYLEENMECSDFKLLKQAIADYESIYGGEHV